MHSPEKFIEKLKESIRVAHETPNRIFLVQTILHVIKTKNDALYQLLSKSHSQAWNNNYIIREIKSLLKKETAKKIDQESSKNIIKYFTLEKTNSKKIVHPSGHLDKHEIDDVLHRGAITNAAIREVEEESLGLIKLTADNYRDVYGNYLFENNGEKYLQFRLFAYIHEDQIKKITEKFEIKRKENIVLLKKKQEEYRKKYEELQKEEQGDIQLIEEELGILKKKCELLEEEHSRCLIMNCRYTTDQKDFLYIQIPDWLELMDSTIKSLEEHTRATIYNK